MVIVEAAVKFGPLCIGEQSKGVNAFKAKQRKAKGSTLYLIVTQQLLHRPLRRGAIK